MSRSLRLGTGNSKITMPPFDIFRKIPRSQPGITRARRSGSARAGFRRVFRQDPHFTLSDDLTVIDFLIHVMHSATADLFARRERLFPSFESRKFGQKRWMDIDDASWETP